MTTAIRYQDADDELKKEMDRFIEALKTLEVVHKETGQNQLTFTCPRCGSEKAQIFFRDPKFRRGGCLECDFQFIT